MDGRRARGQQRMRCACVSLLDGVAMGAPCVPLLQRISAHQRGMGKLALPPRQWRHSRMRYHAEARQRSCCHRRPRAPQAQLYARLP